MKPPKLNAIKVSPEELITMFSSDGFLINNKLPDDVEIVSISYDRNKFSIIIRSDEFDECSFVIPPIDMIPEYVMDIAINSDINKSDSEKSRVNWVRISDEQFNRTLKRAGDRVKRWTNSEDTNNED